MALRSQEVLNWIIRLIREQKLAVGEVLPVEHEISRQLGVGRSTVREALAALKAFGVARSQQGVGLILIADPRRLELMRLFTHADFTLADYSSMIEVRSFIELGAVESLIKNAAKKDIAYLRILIRRVQGLEDPHLDPRSFEIAFHEHIAVLTGNPIVKGLSLLYGPLFKIHSEQVLGKQASDRMPARVVRSHEQVVLAIEKGDAAALRALLQKQQSRRKRA